MKVRLSTSLCEIKLQSIQRDVQGPTAARSLVFHSVEDAQLYLRRFSSSDSVRNMRTLLADGGHSSVNRLSDEQVLRHVAMMVYRRTLSVSENAVRGNPETRRTAASVIASAMRAPPENIEIIRGARKSPLEVAVPTLMAALFDEQVVYRDTANELIDGHLPYILSNPTTNKTHWGQQPANGETPREHTAAAHTLKYSLRYGQFDSGATV